MKGAVIYARYSSEKQNEQSIEGQLRICNQYAENNGLTILDTYIDRAMTGTNDNRPALQQMLSDCSKPVPWDIVLVYAIDRFGRNSIEIAVNKQKLKKNKKTLISATQRTSENIDGTRNLDGIILENVYIGLAEYYSAELSQKVLRGMAENRRKGFFCGGAITYGYRVENKKLVPHELHSKTVLYMFQQYAAGKLVREIIDDLTEQGILFKGKPFLENTVCKMLGSEHYTGVCRRKGEIYTNIYPAIVPKPLFDRVQYLLPRNNCGAHSNIQEFLFRNKMFCGYCGHKLRGETALSRNKVDRYSYYTCKGNKELHICEKQRVNKDEIEKFLSNAIIETLSSSQFISDVADAVILTNKNRSQDQVVMQILTNDRDDLQRSLDNLMKAIEQGIITSTTKNRIVELEEKIATLDDKILVEQCKEQNKLTREQVVEFLTHTIKQSPKYIVATLIQKIVLFEDKAEIYFNYCDEMLPRNSPVNPRDYTNDETSHSLEIVPPRKRTGFIPVLFHAMELKGFLLQI